MTTYRVIDMFELTNGRATFDNMFVEKISSDDDG